MTAPRRNQAHTGIDIMDDIFDPVVIAGVMFRTVTSFNAGTATAATVVTFPEAPEAA